MLLSCAVSAQSSVDQDGAFTQRSDTGAPVNSVSTAPAAPTTMRQPVNVLDRASGSNVEPPLAPIPYVATEFERYVQSQPPTNADQSNADVRRFGANLFVDPANVSIAQDALPAVPDSYIVKPGDEVVLTIWGSVDANIRLTVDRGGMLAVPRVGAVQVGGVRYADLAATIKRRVGEVFRNFQLTATLGRPRAVRVFMTGYVQRPGSITVNGLSSVLHAVMRAGGPSSAGSFRDIRITRQGKQIAVFDLYDLLLKGDRGTDMLVEPDDVVFIGPVGPQAALIGSVNQPAIFELKPGEVLRDMLRMAGGFSAVADRTHVVIERLADRTAGRVSELRLPAHLGDAVDDGDLVRAFSAVAQALPQATQNRRVRIEGEVAHPGDYVMPPGSTIGDAVRAAGGLTPAAYPFGTEFDRESVRITQQANYDRALRDLETDITKNQASQRSTSAEETAAQAAEAASNARLLDRMRQVRPTGRVVLAIPPDATSLPDYVLEDGDHLNIPARGTAVGVFGSVFNSGSFVFVPNHTTVDYLQLAGGPTKGADTQSMFLIRANGSVVSALQGASFWHSGSDFHEAIVVPGDTIFVPEELSKSTFVQSAKDWTQILYQFGLGLAGIRALSVGL